jgi:DNA-directed RNA polymerase beta' subunit
MDYRFKKSIAPTKKVKAIQFGILSPEYINNVSVTQERTDD